MPNWRDNSGTKVFKQTAIPVGLAPTGSVAANGALTSGTAFPLTYSGGIWLYYPAGAAYAGSAAGFFWTVMSSTTLGTIYDTVLGTTYPYIPASPTAIAAAGPGAFTGTSGSDITLTTITLPGGILGLNGALKFEGLWSATNNANVKTAKISYNVTNVHTPVITSAASLQHIAIIRNRGVANRQVTHGYTSPGYATSSVAVLATSIDTSADVPLVIAMNRATATDVVTCEGHTVEIIKP